MIKLLQLENTLTTYWRIYVIFLKMWRNININTNKIISFIYYSRSTRHFMIDRTFTIRKYVDYWRNFVYICAIFA